MTCIVAYDIEDNRIRAKLSRYLQIKGVRLQKSVFAVDIERHTFKRFLKELERLREDDGRIAVFRLCAGCQNSAIQLSEQEKQFYVF